MIDLTRYPELIVKQEIEFLEVFSGFETANRYSVRTPDGEELLFAYEESGMLSRQFLRTHRPLTIHFVDNDSNEVASAKRSFFWMFSHLYVSDEDGNLIGSLKRSFKLLGRRISILDTEGAMRSEIRGGLFRPHTFMVYSDGDEVARITKRWSGLGREMFSGRCVRLRRVRNAQPPIPAHTPSADHSFRRQRQQRSRVCQTKFLLDVLPSLRER